MTGNRSGQGPSGCGRRCCGMRRALALGALGAVSWAAFAGWDEASQTYSTNGYWSLAENGTSSSLTFDSPAKWRDAAGAVPSAFSPDAAYYINCQSYVSTATNTVQGEPVARFPGRVLALGPGSRFLGRGTTEARPFDMGEAVHLLSGATIDTWSGSLRLSGTWTLYPTDDKKCVNINMGSKTSSEQHGFFFRKVTLAGDARTKTSCRGACPWGCVPSPRRPPRGCGAGSTHRGSWSIPPRSSSGRTPTERSRSRPNSSGAA